MTVPDQPPPSSSPRASRFEQALLASVPKAKHAELVPLLRSPDRAVREMALVLIELDREAEAWRAARQATRRAMGQHLNGVAQGW